MKVSIRQLNGALSALQVAKVSYKKQKDLKDLIQIMLKAKTKEVDLSEDIALWIFSLCQNHKCLLRVQKHNEIQRNTIPA